MINPGTSAVAKAIIVGLFILSSVSGCSSPFGNPREEANDAISEANSSIQEHNRLFQQARDTYDEAKQNIEDGDEPDAQREQIVQARSSLQEASTYLEDARTSLSEVENLDVEDALKRYGSILSGAMERQLQAERQEMRFYDILEEDPSLEDNRDEALELLSDVGDGYARAEDEYQRAQELANSNPELLSPANAENADDAGNAGNAGNADNAGNAGN